MTYLKLSVEYLQSLDIESVALLPTIIGIMFAKELTSGEQEMLGNFFTDIGNTLFTTSSLIDIKEAKEKTEKEKAESDKQTSNSEETLQKQIDDLEIQNQEMLKVIQELQKKIKQ